MTAFFSGQDKHRLLTKQFQRKVDLNRHITLIESTAQQNVHPLQRMIYTDMKLWLTGDLLAKGDKVMMAASVELRVPFLDRELVENVVGLHPNQKINYIANKYILRQALSGLLPPRIINRRKMGFPVPIAQWLRGPLKQFAYSQLFGPRIGERGILVPNEIKRLWDAHQTGRSNQSSILWALLVFELWLQIFFDNVALFPEEQCISRTFIQRSTEEPSSQGQVSSWYLQS
jgi:asparagine synthase (glutamine-hydrolysing)